jgi:hypothetical protein
MTVRSVSRAITILDPMSQRSMRGIEQIRERFNIVLPRKWIKPASGRWLILSPGN